MLKRLVLIPVLIMAANARAELKKADVNLNLLTYLIQHDHAGIFGQNESPKPIRFAKLKIKIQKKVAEIGPGGDIYFRSQDVCSGTQTLNVYDAHGGPGFGTSDLKVFSCEAVFKNTHAKINIAGAVSLSSQILFGPKTQEVKSTYPFMWFEGQPLEAEHPILGSYAGTTDIASHAPMLIEIRPEKILSCNEKGRCVPTMQEHFTALLSVED